MEKIIDFIGNNYSWFLTITIILLFALVGYIYDTKKERTDLLKKAENEMEESSLEKVFVPEGKSLNEHVNNSKNVNPETKTVELTDDIFLNENNDIQDITNNN